jgi:uncharacterized protein (TIRG00374 family)
MKRGFPYGRLVLKILVSAGLLAFLLHKISLPELGVLLKGMDAGFVAAAFAVFLASNVAGAVQWHALLAASGVVLPFQQSLRFYFIGLFFNNFLPASIGGDAVKVYGVSKIGNSVYQVVAVTILDRIIGIFSLCLLASAAVGALMIWRPAGALLPYFVVFVACMAPAAVFYLSKPVSRIVRWLVRFVLPSGWGEGGASILDHLGRFKTRKSLILWLMVFSLVIQGMRVATHVLVALALGVRIDAEVAGLFFVFVPLLSLAMIPPITINGLGIREGLGVILFSRAGIGRTDAFAIEFLTYVVSVVTSLLGLAFFLGRRRRRAETRADTIAS